MAVHHRLDGPADAPVLVLSNSLGSDLRMWDRVVAALGGRYRILRYDHPGHGGTAARLGPYTLAELGGDLLALLDRLDLDRVHLGGLSLGGMIGMWVAATAPERVDRLVLCCTAAELGPPQAWHDRAALVRRDGMAAVADAVLDRWVTPGFKADEEEEVARLRAMILATDPEGYAGCCEAIAAMELIPLLPSITAPTLVLSAAQDPATPPALGQAITDAVPSARHVVLDGAAHLASVEVELPMAAEIAAHLDGHADASSRGERTRRAVLGDAHVDAAAARATALTQPWQELITRFAWGDVWSRTELDLPTRSLVTVALLVAVGADAELEMHVRAALRNGVPPEAIVEVVMHASVYVGLPKANAAIGLIAPLLEESTTP